MPFIVDECVLCLRSYCVTFHARQHIHAYAVHLIHLLCWNNTNNYGFVCVYLYEIYLATVHICSCSACGCVFVLVHRL